MKRNINRFPVDYLFYHLNIQVGQMSDFLLGQVVLLHVLYQIDTGVICAFLSTFLPSDSFSTCDVSWISLFDF